MKNYTYLCNISSICPSSKLDPPIALSTKTENSFLLSFMYIPRLIWTEQTKLYCELKWWYNCMLNLASESQQLKGLTEMSYRVYFTYRVVISSNGLVHFQVPVCSVVTYLQRDEIHRFKETNLWFKNMEKTVSKSYISEKGLSSDTVQGSIKCQ